MEQILKRLLVEENPNAEIILNRTKYTDFNSFIEILAKGQYNLKDELGCATATVTKLLKRLLPARIDSSKPHNWLLNRYGHKVCTKCKEVKLLGEFSDSYCKPCTTLYNRNYEKIHGAARQAHKKSIKLQRTPKWANINKINEIYLNCPEGYHVDHIIPLQGENICGLHVENNLQYLLPQDNRRKSNCFIGE